MPKTNGPTDAEIEAARDILNRAAERERNEQAERMKPVSDLVGSAGFRQFYEAINAIPQELLVADRSLDTHINAVRVGMNGLFMYQAGPEAVPASPQA